MFGDVSSSLLVQALTPSSPPPVPPPSRSSSSRRYLVGTDFLAGPGYGPTLADMSFFPSLAYMMRLGLRLEGRWPNLHAYFERMCSRPSVLSTWPPHWKATPGFPILS